MRDTIKPLGVVAFISPDDARTLEECARGCNGLARHRRKGWLAEYVRLHTQASRVIRVVIDRAAGQNPLPLD